MKLSSNFVALRVVVAFAICTLTAASMNATEGKVVLNALETTIDANQTFYEEPYGVEQRDLQAFFFQGGDVCRCEASWENLVSSSGGGMDRQYNIFPFLRADDILRRLS